MPEKNVFQKMFRKWNVPTGVLSLKWLITEQGISNFYRQAIILFYPLNLVLRAFYILSRWRPLYRVCWWYSIISTSPLTQLTHCCCLYILMVILIFCITYSSCYTLHWSNPTPSAGDVQYFILVIWHTLNWCCSIQLTGHSLYFRVMYILQTMFYISF